MEQTAREPWGVLVGVTILSLVVVFLASCSLPAVDLGAITDTGGGAGQDTLAGSASPAPDPQLVESAESGVASDAERDAALAYLNDVRATLGLAPLGADAAADRAARAHADYLWRNVGVDTGLTAHEEVEGLPGFTGVHYWDRLAVAGLVLEDCPALGEVVATHPRAVSAVVHWLETAYHRLPLVAPEAGSAGYGHVIADGRAANVMVVVGRPEAASDYPPLVAFPPPDSVGVPTKWDGMEAPQPPAPSGGWPSGPVLSLSTSLGTPIVVDEHTIREVDGAEIAHTLLTPESDANLARASAVVLYPSRPLARGTRYVVRVTGSVGTLPFSRTWGFETAAEAEDCQPGEDDCTAGRACYHLVPPFTCEYEGVLPERAPCAHANDCAPGLTCFRGACQPYCLPGEAQGGVGACRDCTYGHLPLALGEDAPGICLPPACDPHGDECGADMWCTWGGAFACDRMGPEAAGGSCWSTDACERGSSCLDLGDGFKCRSLCALETVAASALGACATLCPGGALPVDFTSGVAICP